MEPDAPFNAARHCFKNTNVLETTFTTGSGVLCITDPMNSTGRASSLVRVCPPNRDARWHSVKGGAKPVQYGGVKVGRLIAVYFICFVVLYFIMLGTEPGADDAGIERWTLFLSLECVSALFDYAFHPVTVLADRFFAKKLDKLFSGATPFPFFHPSGQENAVSRFVLVSLRKIRRRAEVGFKVFSDLASAQQLEKSGGETTKNSSEDW